MNKIDEMFVTLKYGDPIADRRWFNRLPSSVPVRIVQRLSDTDVLPPGLDLGGYITAFYFILEDDLVKRITIEELINYEQESL